MKSDKVEASESQRRRSFQRPGRDSASPECFSDPIADFRGPCLQVLQSLEAHSAGDRIIHDDREVLRVVWLAVGDTNPIHRVFTPVRVGKAIRQVSSYLAIVCEVGQYLLVTRLPEANIELVARC